MKEPRPSRVVAATALAVACFWAVPMRATQGAKDLVELVPGTTYERELAGGQSHEFRVSLGPGNFGQIVVDQQGIDVVIVVADAAGAPLAEFDAESRIVGRETAGLAASDAGYRVVVKPRYPKAQVGRYIIRLADVRSSTDQDRRLFDAHALGLRSAGLETAGKYEEAQTLAAQAVNLVELGGDEAYTAYLLTRLGELQRTRGDFQHAEETFQRAIATSEGASGRVSLPTSYPIQRLGALYNATDDASRAEPLLEEALKITETIGGPEHPRVVTCLMSLSALHHEREDFVRVLAEGQRALAIAQRTFDPDDFSMIALISNLGDVNIDLHNYQTAETLTVQALHQLEAKFGPENPRVTGPLLNLGAIFHATKRYDQALESLNRGLRIRERTLGAQHPMTAEIVLTIGNVYRSAGDYTKALDAYARARQALEQTAGPYHRLTLRALISTSVAYSAQGDIAHALEYEQRANRVLDRTLELNLAVGSDREKAVFMSAWSAGTDRTVSLHTREAPENIAAADLAALVLLQRKGRLLDAASGGLAALRARLDAVDRALLDELDTTTADLARLALSGPGKMPPDEYRTRLAGLEARKDTIEGSVSARSAEFRGQYPVVSLDAVRAAIPRDAALIEYAVYRPFDPKAAGDAEAFGERRYVAYVLRAQQPTRWRDIGTADDIDRTVAALREALRDPKRQDVRDRARAADERLLQPLRALVGNAERLLVSPDGSLNLVPFEALLDEDGRFEVERHAISYLTSGRDLLRMQLVRASHSEPVVVADPLFGEPPRDASAPRAATGSVYFAPLSGTAGEARAIQALFPESRVLSRAQATKAALKQLKAPSILHIATHGFFLDDAAASRAAETSPAGGTRAIVASVNVANPLLRSGLALSGANLATDAVDDGILTALEASNLDLWGTKLVTLSACDTGVGEIKNGEGVYGLRRAFVLAGAETLVMSLWPVSDTVSREVMTSFYTGLREGRGRSDALRRAQLAMLARKPRQHPFYWAGFILAGEWASLDGRR